MHRSEDVLSFIAPSGIARDGPADVSAKTAYEQSAIQEVVGIEDELIVILVVRTVVRITVHD
jgi:hypothetical protein